MSRPLAVLNIEDSENDSQLIDRLLKKAGYDVTFERVETAEKMRAALKEQAWDIVIADCSLPQFNGRAALALLQETGLDIPFIAVSGTVGEETIVEMMKAGAHDYMLKDNLIRLAPAVERELAQNKVRRERKQAQEMLYRRDQEFKTLVENSPDAITRFDKDGRYQYVNPARAKFFDLPAQAIIGKTWWDLLGPEEKDEASIADEAFKKMLDRTTEHSVEYQTRTPQGMRWVHSRSVPEFAMDGSLESILVITRDITNRKQAEEELRKNFEQRQAILQSAMDGFWMVDMQGHLLEVNETYCRMSGYNAQELLTMRIPDLEVIEKADDTAAHLQKVVQQGEDRFESRHRRKDGSIFDVEISVQYQPIEGGLMVCFLRDITGNKQAEAALRESEEKYRGLVETAQELVWKCDSNGRFTYLNPAWEKTCGYRMDEMLGKGFGEFQRPDVYERDIDEFSRHLAGGFVRGYETSYIAKDGREIALLFNAIPVFAVDGTIVGTQGTAIDITERKQAEQALRESEKRFRSVMDTVSLIGVILDMEGRIRHCNDFLLSLTGWKREELLGQNWFEIFLPPEIRGNIENGIFLKSVATGEIPTHFVNEIVTRQGSRRLVQWSNTILYDQNGSVTDVASIGEDITERKQAEDALQESERFAYATLDALSAHIAILDETGAILAVNRSWRAFAEANSSGGSNLKLCEGVNYLSVCETSSGSNSEEAMAMVAGIRAVISGQQKEFSLEYPCHAPDEKRWFNVRVTRFPGEGAVRIVIAHENITERRKAEDALRESETRFRILSDNALTGIYILQDGVLKYVNPALATIFGYVPAELTGADPLIVIEPGDRALVTENIRRRIVGETKNIQYEFHGICKNGEIKIIEVLGTGIIMDGRPAIIGNILDISARKQAERSLREREEQYRTLVEQLPAIVYIDDVNADGHSLYISPQVETLLGFTPQVWQENSPNLWKKQVHPDDLERSYAGYLRCLQYGEPFSAEYRIYTSDGRLMWFRDQAIRLCDEDGHPRVTHGLMSDITEYKQAEQALHQRLLELEMLYESGLALSHLLAPKEIGQKIIDLLEEKLDWHHAAVRLLHPDDTLELLAFSLQGLQSEHDKREVGQRFQTLISHSGQGLSGWVAQHGQAVRSTDLSNDARYVYIYPGLRSGLYVPIQLGGHVFGVISIESKQPDAFSEADERLAVTLAMQAANAFENSRLFNAAQQRVAELTTLHRVSQTLLAARLDPDDIYNAVHQAVAQTMPCDAFMIVLDDEDRGDYHAIYFLDRGKRFAPRRLPRGEGLSGRVISSGESILVDDVQKEKDFPMNHFGSQEIVRSVLAVPLRRDDEIIGMLSTQSYQPHVFDEAQRSLLETISAQLASAINNAHLYQQTQARIKELEVLHKISVSLRTIQTVDNALPILLDETLAALETDTGAIMLYQPASDDLHVAIARGWLQDINSSPIKAGEGIAGAVFAAGQSYSSREFIHDKLLDPTTENNIPAGWGGACLPIRIGSEISGVLFVSVPLPRQVTPEQMKLLNSFAEIVGATLLRMKLYEETAHRAQEFALLYETSTALSSENQLNSLLQTIVENARNLLGANSGGMYLVLPGSDLLELTMDSASIALGTQFHIGEGMAGRVAQTRRPLRVDDYSNWEGRSPKYESLNFRAALEVPMLYGGELIGVLTVNEINNSERKYTEADERLLSLFATQAAGAIHSARLLEKTERRLNHLQSLRTVEQAIASSLDMHFTLNVLLTHAVSQLAVDAADILLLNPFSRTLDFTTGYGFHTRMTDDASMSISESLAGPAVMQHRSMLALGFEAVSQSPRLRRFWKEEGFSSYSCVPLIIKGEVRGVLEVYHRTPFTPDFEWVEFLETFASQAAVTIDNTQLFETLQRANMDLVMAYDATIEGWSRAMDLRDKETEGHTQRVTEKTLSLAKAMGINKKEMLNIRRGALLHDIGKMGVPDHILLKEGKLTDEEWVIMHKHPALARDMLTSITYLSEAINIPYCHHEKWDGNGYPQGLKGEQIPLIARLFAIVDVWDALTSDRPYRKKWTKKKSLAYIREQRGKHFDPKVVDAFEKMIVGK